MSEAYILTLSCEDRPGLVATVAGFLHENGCNILEASQFNDRESDIFFMRVMFELCDGRASMDPVRDKLTALANRHGMSWSLRSVRDSRRVLLMVSRLDHCLGDLLYRHRVGELNMDVVGIISNHPRDALTISAIDDIPFHHLPITKQTRPQQEARIRQIVDETRAELVVLARYMQVLSGGLARCLEGRCINIHHSFLPGFKGAKPYHQAHARGVKMIGATANYVTADLDEGPIIAQDVEHITHTDTPDDLIRKGRDIERCVLARAVSYHLQDRVLLNGTRTIFFRD